ncbi:hypothetical protein CMV_009349 [Castanea mollissima]|uniref:Uncharacterized protein n=1 Tax=Castanea mollissima TaxID=60419 RepID=A0A8J4RMV6_9ROSI|nr:hypothetical protein CMV_009349 [Castanea mollissima]
MPNACLLGESNLLFQKTLIFLEITPNLWASSSQGQGMQPRQGSPHGRAAKAKACSQALGSQGQGMLQRPRQPPWACCQGQGMQPGPRQPRPRPRHAQATQPRPRQPPWALGSQGMHKPCSQGQGTPHGRAAKAKACTSHAAKAKAAPMGVLPRPSHAQGMQPGPRQPRPRQPSWARCQGQGTHKACSQALGSPHVHAAAMAKAAPMGTLPRPRHAQGMQPGPRQPPCACSSQGQGSPHGRAAKAQAAP